MIAGSRATQPAFQFGRKIEYCFGMPQNRLFNRITLLDPVWDIWSPFLGTPWDWLALLLWPVCPDSLVRWPISAVSMSWGTRLSDVVGRASWFQSMAVRGDLLPLESEVAKKAQVFGYLSHCSIMRLCWIKFVGCVLGEPGHLEKSDRFHIKIHFAMSVQF